jgi:hypothetical protein
MKIIKLGAGHGATQPMNSSAPELNGRSNFNTQYITLMSLSSELYSRRHNAFTET